MLILVEFKRFYDTCPSLKMIFIETLLYRDSLKLNCRGSINIAERMTVKTSLIWTRNLFMIFLVTSQSPEVEKKGKWTGCQARCARSPWTRQHTVVAAWCSPTRRFSMRQGAVLLAFMITSRFGFISYHVSLFTFKYSHRIGATVNCI